MSARIHFHVAWAKKRPNIPDNSADAGKCPKCAGETREGYGLAGGGMGSYTYREPCGMIVTKTEDPASEDGA